MARAPIAIHITMHGVEMLCAQLDCCRGIINADTPRDLAIEASALSALNEIQRMTHQALNELAPDRKTMQLELIVKTETQKHAERRTPPALLGRR